MADRITAEEREFRRHALRETLDQAIVNHRPTLLCWAAKLEAEARALCRERECDGPGECKLDVRTLKSVALRMRAELAALDKGEGR